MALSSLSRCCSRSLTGACPSTCQRCHRRSSLSQSFSSVVPRRSPRGCLSPSCASLEELQRKREELELEIEEFADDVKAEVRKPPELQNVQLLQYVTALRQDKSQLDTRIEKAGGDGPTPSKKRIYLVESHQSAPTILSLKSRAQFDLYMERRQFGGLFLRVGVPLAMDFDDLVDGETYRPDSDRETYRLDIDGETYRPDEVEGTIPAHVRQLEQHSHMCRGWEDEFSRAILATVGGQSMPKLRQLSNSDGVAVQEFDAVVLGEDGTFYLGSHETFVYGDLDVKAHACAVANTAMFANSGSAMYPQHTAFKGHRLQAVFMAELVAEAAKEKVETCCAAKGVRLFGRSGSAIVEYSLSH